MMKEPILLLALLPALLLASCGDSGSPQQSGQPEGETEEGAEELVIRQVDFEEKEMLDSLGLDVWKFEYSVPEGFVVDLDFVVHTAGTEEPKPIGRSSLKKACKGEIMVAMFDPSVLGGAEDKLVFIVSGSQTTSQSTTTVLGSGSVTHEAEEEFSGTLRSTVDNPFSEHKQTSATDSANFPAKHGMEVNIFEATNCNCITPDHPEPVMEGDKTYTLTLRLWSVEKHKEAYPFFYSDYEVNPPEDDE